LSSSAIWSKTGFCLAAILARRMVCECYVARHTYVRSAS